MDNSRLRILEYLQSRGLVTAIEASHALNMTASNARHHLAILAREGVVQVFGLRKGAERGRPTRIFVLSEIANRHNLAALSHALLAQLFDRLSAEQAEAEIRDLANRLSPDTFHLPRNPVQKLNEVIAWLNAMGYQARWEAHARAPKIIFQHCPYKAILPQHPELCQVDTHLLENSLATRVTLTERLTLSDLGLPQCTFDLILTGPVQISSTS